ncbi:MAG: hypothetical protein EPN85_08275 [Bacteroidetes bacterium]|nr:MAG: hypothetical protein EPN85_08275 [Bacteroidota bacterium]
MKTKLLIAFLILCGISNNQVNAQISFEKFYGGANRDDGFSVKQTSDSGYIILGTTVTNIPDIGSLYVIRTDKFGDTLWTKMYGDSLTYVWGNGFHIEESSNKSFLLFGSLNEKMAFMKIDSLGNILWTKIYSDGTCGWSFMQTKDKGFILSGGY